MATAAPNDNRCYLYRLLLLNIDVGTVLVRNLIDDKCSNTTLATILARERETIHKLRRMTIISKVGFDLLYPQSGIPPTTSDFGFTLAIFLLRNLKHFGLTKFRWNVTPKPEDISLEADIWRLEMYHKKLVHNITFSAAGIEVADFIAKRADIQRVLHRLNCSVKSPVQNLQQAIDDCKCRPLEFEAEKEIEKQTEVMQKMKDILEIEKQYVKRDIIEVLKDVKTLNKDVKSTKSTNKEMAEMKIQMESEETTLTGNIPPKKIKVTGLPKELDGNYLTMYFENERRGGGNVADVTIDRNQNSAIIEFEEAAAVDKVMEKRPIMLRGTVVNVEVLTDETYNDSSTKLRVRGLPPNMTSEVLTFYFEDEKRQGGGMVKEVTIEAEGNSAVVEFEKATAVKVVMGKQPINIFGTTVEVEIIDAEEEYFQLPKSRKIKVSGIPKDTNEDILTFVFENENRQGGGKVTDVCLYEKEGFALVEFEEIQAVEKVLDKQPIYFLGCEVKVERFDAEEEHFQLPKSRKIKVSGLSKRTTEEILIIVFEDEKRQGGGKVTDVCLYEKEGFALVEFEENQAVEKVLDKQPIYFFGWEVKVERFGLHNTKHLLCTSVVKDKPVQQILDIPHNKANSSTEDVQAFCYKCGSVANSYCRQCGNNLCNSCVALHYPALDIVREPNQSYFTCLKHKSRAKFHCLNHNIFICNYCRRNHSNCNYSEIHTVDITEKKLADLKEFCKSRSEQISESETECKRSLINILADIKRFRQEINQRLDEMEREIVLSVETHKRKCNSIFETAKKKCDDVKVSVHSVVVLIKQLETLQTMTNNSLIKLAAVQTEINRCSNALSKLELPRHEHYHFKSNPAIVSLFQKEKSLGTLELLSPPKGFNMAARQPKFRGDICVKPYMDRNLAWITGIAFLDPGLLVITDKDNNSVKLIDITKTSDNTKELELVTSPWDITSVSIDEFALTLPFKQRIQFISVSRFFHSITKKRSIKVNGKCYGISSYDKKLIVSFQDPAKLQIIDLQGLVIKTIAKNSDGVDMFMHPNYVVADKNQIVVSDWKQHSIIRLNWQGEQTGNFQGIAIPQGIALLDDGSLLVSDFGGDTCTVQYIATKFKTGKVVLDDLCKPFALCWHGTYRGGTLYISSGGGDEKNCNFIQKFEVPTYHL